MNNLNFLINPFIILTLFVSIIIVLVLLKLLRDSKRNFQKLTEELRYSVQPKFIQLSQGVNELVDLATEVWRINSRIAKVSKDLPQIQQKGIESSIQKLMAYLSRYDIEIIDYTGKKYNEGLNLDVLSIEKDLNVKIPFVKETIEPTILCKGQVVKKAKIILVSN